MIERTIGLAILSLGLLSMLMGCASSPWERANCTRFRHKGYNVLACDDTAVGQHCKRKAKTTDSGGPVNYYPRACHEKNRWHRKDIIVIGKSFMACLDHEICHHEHPGNPLFCEQNFPCVGDKK